MISQVRMGLERAMCKAGEGEERQWDSSDMGIPSGQSIAAIEETTK
jgi:hypothetical protein